MMEVMARLRQKPEPRLVHPLCEVLIHRQRWFIPGANMMRVVLVVMLNLQCGVFAFWT